MILGSYCFFFILITCIITIKVLPFFSIVINKRLSIYSYVHLCSSICFAWLAFVYTYEACLSVIAVKTSPSSRIRVSTWRISFALVQQFTRESITCRQSYFQKYSSSIIRSSTLFCVRKSKNIIMV